jgi:Flp pilus assembly protein TadG
MQQMYLSPRLTIRAARRQGAAAAELALMLPVLTFVFIVAIDFCRLFYAYNVITNCARNGALWASDPYANGTVTPSQSPYATVQDAALADANNLSTPAPTVAQSPTSPVLPGATVSVTVTYNFSMVSSYLGFGSLSLSRSVAMRVTQALPTPG